MEKMLSGSKSLLSVMESIFCVVEDIFSSADIRLSLIGQHFASPAGFRSIAKDTSIIHK
jgi:hypothetical protein